MTEGQVPVYEEEVQRSFNAILEEAGEFFMQRGRIHQSLLDLTRRLDQAGIPYAVIGAIALSYHGLTRMTLDVDILLTPDGLAEFKARYLGRGYVPAFAGAERTFRAADSGVRIEVVTAGEYPGDGLPKAVSFPHPADASIEAGGVRVITLERLVELKLASGMTAPHRLRDLSDVQDLIRTLRLPDTFSDGLDPSVRSVFQRLWQTAQGTDQVQEG
jgi:hypothetical protein